MVLWSLQADAHPGLGEQKAVPEDVPAHWHSHEYEERSGTRMECFAMAVLLQLLHLLLMLNILHFRATVASREASGRGLSRQGQAVRREHRFQPAPAERVRLGVA